MGQERHTTLNLQVVAVDEERNLLMIKGAVPGADQGLVTVRRAIKKRNAR
jgi:large subunit ribosomal protein L3